MKYMITKFKIFEDIKNDLYNSLHYGTIDKLKELLATNPDLDEHWFNQFSLGGYLIWKACDNLTNMNYIKELTKAGANWFEKNDRGLYFIDYLSNFQKEQLQKEFSQKYHEYLMRKEAEEKYNL